MRWRRPLLLLLLLLLRFGVAHDLVDAVVQLLEQVVVHGGWVSWPVIGWAKGLRRPIRQVASVSSLRVIPHPSIAQRTSWLVVGVDWLVGSLAGMGHLLA